MERPEPGAELTQTEDRFCQIIDALQPFRAVIECGEKVKVVINLAGDRCRVTLEYWEPKVI